MNKFIYNYHSHTYRCGHAVGRDIDYINEAIKSGIKYLGFSDHVFLKDFYLYGMRGDYSELNEYSKMVDKYKLEYQNEIKIYKGFECEYDPRFVSYYKSLLEKKGFDYLILGQHCYFENGDNCFYFCIPLERKRYALKKYTDDLIEGMETGLFAYVAHPDLMMEYYKDWDDLAIDCAKRIIEASIKYNVPLEINLCRVRFNRTLIVNGIKTFTYPYYYFWKLVSEYKDVHVVYGMDIHNPVHYQYPGTEEVTRLEKTFNLKIDYNFKLKPNYFRK